MGWVNLSPELSSGIVDWFSLDVLFERFHFIGPFILHILVHKNIDLSQAYDGIFIYILRIIIFSYIDASIMFIAELASEADAQLY